MDENPYRAPDEDSGREAKRPWSIWQICRLTLALGSFVVFVASATFLAGFHVTSGGDSGGLSPLCLFLLLGTGAVVATAVVSFVREY